MAYLSASRATPDDNTNINEYSKRQRWFDLVLVMVVSFTIPILNSTLILLHPDSVLLWRSFPNFRLIIGLTQESLSLLVFAYVLARQGRPLNSIGLDFRWHDPLVAVLLAIAALMLYYAISIAIQFLSIGISGRPTEIRNIDLTTGASTGFVLAYIFLSPVFEETLVRGFLMTELVGLGKPIWAAAIISITLQTSYHFYYGIAGGFAISGGFIVFALYFGIARRLLPVILGHLYLDLSATLFHMHH